jgi:hypothetical protein
MGMAINVRLMDGHGPRERGYSGRRKVENTGVINTRTTMDGVIISQKAPTFFREFCLEGLREVFCDGHKERYLQESSHTLPWRLALMKGVKP